MSKLLAVGADAHQRLNLVTKVKARRDAKASNRTWEIPPSGFMGGLGKRGHGGIANPPRNRKVESGWALFADAAGGKQSISCLPLAEGYNTAFRNFDIQKQKVELMQLKVSGVEKVTVPAGTFDAYRVEISSADGGADKETIWIARDSQKAVKESAVLASMGGAVMTQELVP